MVEVCQLDALLAIIIYSVSKVTVVSQFSFQWPFVMLQGAEPYCMVDAADHLEKLARQELGRGPLLDVSRSASALYDHA